MITGRGGSRLDYYTLRLLLAPMAVILGVLLLAMLLERLLRAVEMVAGAGGDSVAAVKMALFLTPHYLGLALPAAFFAAVFMAIAKLGDDNELDAMLAAGRSIHRISAPFIQTGLLLALIYFALVSFLQPFGRYAYYAERDAATSGTWNARVQDHRFIDTGRAITLTADAVDGTGRRLEGVFLQRLSGDAEEITTARRGRLVPAADGQELLLSLEDGVLLRESAAGRERLDFRAATIRADLRTAAPPFRRRGGSERELTLPELWREMRSSAPALPLSELQSEMHARLARTLLVPVLPLLAVPLGMAAKRGRRTPGVVFAAVGLLSIHQILLFGENLAEAGQLSVWLGLWLPWAVFTLAAIWLFRASLLRPGDNPVTRAVASMESGLAGIRPRRMRRTQTGNGGGRTS